MVTSIAIANRKDKKGDKLRNVTVRAGLHPEFRADLNESVILNEACGKFEGPGETGKTHIINCSSPIIAEYITVQMLRNFSVLSVNELEVFSEPHVLNGK